MKEIISRLSTYHLKEAYYAELNNVLAHVEVVKRLDRAYDILTRSREYSISVSCRKPLTFSIQGPNDTYSIIESERLCTCPDGETLCKHRLTVKLVLATIQLQKRDGWKIVDSYVP